MGHHAGLIFVFVVETGFLHVSQAGLKLLTSGHPPALASQSAGITGVSQHTQPQLKPSMSLFCGPHELLFFPFFFFFEMESHSVA